MEDRKHIETTLEDILGMIKPLEEIDFSQNLFGRHNDFKARDMVYVFMELKKALNVNLNDLVKSLDVYTTDNIIDIVYECLSEKNDKKSSNY